MNETRMICYLLVLILGLSYAIESNVTNQQPPIVKNVVRVARPIAHYHHTDKRNLSARHWIIPSAVSASVTLSIGYLLLRHQRKIMMLEKEKTAEFAHQLQAAVETINDRIEECSNAQLRKQTHLGMQQNMQIENLGNSFIRPYMAPSQIF